MPNNGPKIKALMGLVEINDDSTWIVILYGTRAKEVARTESKPSRKEAQAEAERLCEANGWLLKSIR
jgi:hypothetical protein